MRLEGDLIKIQCVTCQQRRRGGPTNNRPQQQFNNQQQFQQQQTFQLRRPQFVLRTANRDRIGAFNNNNNNNLQAGTSIQRIANAAKTKNVGVDFSQDEQPEEQQQQKKGQQRKEGGTKKAAEKGGDGGDLSEEFRKLERLLNSAEEYLDVESGGGAAANGRKQQKGKRRGKEVQSWTAGHPQGDGFSPLKINPLRRAAANYHSEQDGSQIQRPKPVFYSTDRLHRSQRNDEVEEEEYAAVQKRAQREAGAAEPLDTNGGETIATEIVVPSSSADDKNAKKQQQQQLHRLNLGGSVKLQMQEPAGLRELPTMRQEEEEEKTAAN